MLEIGSRARPQPPPPRVVFEALTRPDRPGGRRWLALLDDEPDPGPALTGHFRKRLDQLVNAELRCSFGQ